MGACAVSVPNLLCLRSWFTDNTDSLLESHHLYVQMTLCCLALFSTIKVIFMFQNSICLVSLSAFRDLHRTIDCFHAGNVYLNVDVTHKGQLT